MLIPKLYENFPSTPVSDPLYKINGTATYQTSPSNRLRISGNYASFEILNSAHTYGSLETDIHFGPNTGGGTDKNAIRAFGYIFVSMFQRCYVFDDNNEDWINFNGNSNVWMASDNQFGTKKPALRFTDTSLHNVRATIKIIATNCGVDFYINGIIFHTAPVKNSALNIKYFNGGNEGPDLYLYSISLKTDSSLPELPIITAPAEAGTINAAQEIISSIPASRLFVDLGSFAPGITGLTSVVYDPGGANVSMSEDTGIPDRAGATSGNYYLEIPSNGVAHDYRLTVKEAFVLAHSVATSDSIGFDVTGGPSSQTGTVTEDDDLECYLNLFSHPGANKGEVPLGVLGVVPLLHNVNADGNISKINNANLNALFDFSTGTLLSYTSGVSFPIIIDVDLGRIYHITRVNSIQQVSNSVQLTGFDIYSNTVPFSGATVQGNLEYTAYPITSTATVSVNTPAQMVQAPTLAFDTRYLRFYIPDSSYFNASLSTNNYWPYILDILVSDWDSINSVDDAGQFEVDTGGGFGAWPGGGVTQGSGYVRITLPSPLQVASGDRVFASIQFKSDLTD